MNQAIKGEFDRWVKLFEELEGCKLVDRKMKDNRLMVENPFPVPWHENLHAERSESKEKIGYLFPQESGVKLDIDFPHQSFTKEYLQTIVDPNHEWPYYSPENKAPTAKSWWRFRSEPHFDTLTLVVRKEYLGKIDTTDPKLKELFQEIIDLAKG
ncbi:hypothetical protein [Texcoconibacillus texcoconensis]|uniref:Uncharacterized protein n=1 Tax=Texcoconibacillus texcoconensis TaxID=1095777 RepID=A0A840QT45_9BACI|nr:hypothetical protein [Texcoconibacillus texcoconensis]MBB5174534.1 hypothetical protein [Texcoconibacillus texcoconensis]